MSEKSWEGSSSRDYPEKATRNKVAPRSKSDGILLFNIMRPSSTGWKEGAAANIGG